MSYDVDLSHGDGPLVEESALALLLVSGGRGVALDELRGSGLPTLRERLTRLTSAQIETVGVPEPETYDRAWPSGRIGSCPTSSTSRCRRAT